MRANVVLNAIGLILKYFGVLLFLPVIFALIFHEANHILPFACAAVISILFGFLFNLNKADDKEINEIKKSEALFIVFFSWVILGLVCAIPYLFYNLSVVNSLFESYSGITTTGMTIFADFSLYPKTLFFYRAMTQWIGGMGVIVLFVGVLPKFAVAGRQMFFAESPGPVEEKLTPRVHSMALRLWLIYIALTVLEAILLYFVGHMNIYYSICTALSTMSSGGFMPDASNVAMFINLKIHWIIIVFMFLSGCNFVLQYKVFVQRKFKSLINNEELRVYTSIILIASSLIAFIIWKNNSIPVFEAITDSLFTVISAITTTGFLDSNYNLWNIDAKIILFAVMLIGGCASSTSGGIKVIRWVYVYKYLKKEIAKIIHPNAVYPIKLEGTTISQDVRYQLLAFVFFYIMFFALSAFFVGLIEENPVIAMSGSISTLGNIGLGLGQSFAPVDKIDSLHTATKFIFIFNMIIGRLELIPFLALLHPDAWRKN